MILLVDDRLCFRALCLPTRLSGHHQLYIYIKMNSQLSLLRCSENSDLSDLDEVSALQNLISSFQVLRACLMTTLPKSKTKTTAMSVAWLACGIIFHFLEAEAPVWKNQNRCCHLCTKHKYEGMVSWTGHGSKRLRVTSEWSTE